MRVGLVGRAKELDELQVWLEACAQGVEARQDTALGTLFPGFPGLEGDATFRSALAFDLGARRELSSRQLRAMAEVAGDVATMSAAADLLAGEISALLDSRDVDVVLVARPAGIPDGSAGAKGMAGLPRGGGGVDPSREAVLVSASPSVLEGTRSTTW